jgi:hypothetical protein
MAKVTYDLTGVDDLPDEAQAPVGTYIGKIEAAEAKPSSNGNPMIEVRWRLTHDATGAKLKENYQAIWDYPILEHNSSFVMGKTKAFFAALGIPLKGTLDTKKMEGKKALLKLKSDTDDGGDYRPRIGKILPVSEAESEPADVEEEEPEAEQEEESVDLSELDRDGLKKLIRSEGLGTLKDLGITAKTSDDDIRAIIADKMGLGEPEEEPEAEGDGYDSLDIKALADDFKERGLDEKPLKGLKGAKLKAKVIELLREDDASSPF